MNHALARTQLDNLRADLQQLAGQRISNHAFSAAARAQGELLQSLPPRYGEVLLGLLDRLEAGAMFTEESCSFSHSALVDALTQWASKAEAALQAQAGPNT
ncbi:hypothetical protein GCM10027019_20160 [Melaminivora jejuensis]|uniref:hypothetical protein n=1 Tax=Melaminivora jejuensis TaxID=1267217 RepID=UPI001AE010AF|nr:hypothetical protein [Melaminivora jejuensis]UHJ64710.1 hypothetical protein LVC68_15480 [Melaminivora jejuensis]